MLISVVKASRAPAGWGKKAKVDHETGQLVCTRNQRVAI